ncbi:glycerol ethanol, ferric requiring protein [Mucor velutinosus]|uniref:ATPase n=1 Tax=Mucor velutinosus TaxID=708070 RepID=A0AAN7D3F8_9FUNG|nr:Non-histone chromosomal protein 6 [Mucor velutinosus]KAK4511774.1 hypothetical protein ATC70_003773 [Mucor velutinosus]KAK4513308.1 hypothetical protein ATC70_011876 [Mucor velutinosus]KAK4514148.1 hypothetical protein ATC70_001735 [Mucor velutinosus]KAK4515311.1 hypothetical protein ATC70_010255 [Mucor velutinosus]
MNNNSDNSLYSKINEQGFPILIHLDNLRVATEALIFFPAVASVWSSFPKWCQEAIMYSMNDVFKIHHHAQVGLVKALDSLKAHLVNGTFPQVVLAAVPGVKNLHMDNSLSDADKSLFSSSIENAVLSARSAILKTLIESKERALQAHQLQASPAFVLAQCRDRIFESILAMGGSIEHLTDTQIHDVVRSLCHLRHNMNNVLETQAWARVQAERKQQKAKSAADTVMESSSDLSSAQLTDSITKLVNKTVQSKISALDKKLSKLTVSGSSSRPSSRRPAASSSSRKQGNPKSSSSSGKGSRPLSGPTKGRIQKGAPNPNRRLAPGPTPFKALKGKRG